MKILMVLTSHDTLGSTSVPAGFWLEEFAAPYYAFLDAGAEITVASPKGGRPPLDPASDAPSAHTQFTNRLTADPDAQAVLDGTVPLATSRPQSSTRCSSPVATAPCATWPRTSAPLP